MEILCKKLITEEILLALWIISYSVSKEAWAKNVSLVLIGLAVFGIVINIISVIFLKLKSGDL